MTAPGIFEGFRDVPAIQGPWRKRNSADAAFSLSRSSNRSTKEKRKAGALWRIAWTDRI